jgi:hypothetical protein
MAVGFSRRFSSSAPSRIRRTANQRANLVITRSVLVSP